MAIIGKYVGTYVAARVSGIEKREASALGWLMNTRGLTELIVLNIGLSFGVISPLLFTMLVIMALVTTFMTSPLLEKTYPKELIKLDVVQPEPEAISPQPVTPSYRVLVPVANPNTHIELLNLALAIAGKPPAVVHPLSLIELEEDYLFQSTPDEANYLMKQQQQRLEELIQSLEPPEVRKGVHPIIRIAYDVAKETGEIALADQANLILVGWHRPAFSDNRLGGRVGQILNTSPTDVAVFVSKEQHQIQSLLVAYASNIHDDLGLTLALRMLFNDPNRQLKILVTLQEPDEEFSYELRNVIDALPPPIQARVQLIRVEDTDPIQAVIEASTTVDLTIAGTSRTWGIERQTLGRYTDQLAQDCHSSLLITRSYSQVASHIASLLQQPINQ